MRRAAAVVLALSMLLGTHRTASAQTAPSSEALAEAKRHYDLGRKLYDERDYNAAYAELTRAYELAPTPNLFYNLGLVHVARRDYAAALGALERYLGEAGQVTSERRTEVESLIATAKGRVATLELQVAESGVDVFVDDVLIGKTPLAKPVFVNAGEHRVRISHAGRLATRTVIVTGGELRKLDLGFEVARDPVEPRAPGTAPIANATPTPAAPRAERSKPPLWIGWVATGALAAGATFTGFSALSKQNQLEDQSHERGVTRDELDSTRTKMRTYAILTDVLVVGAVVVGGVTLYLSLDQGTERTAKRSLEIGIGPTSASLRSRF